ncbi:thiaminase II [Campylobacter geochelonis]|uniref:Aminopyrimidine aminohydrolase n=1 Tax=Campylobacter geochelonis TaxID=1780362 RepID=A0A128EHC0_9BACT|nr:thiaminase II [Campylobacter geochelonis]QKF70865.1 transcriptional regulator, TenA family [Campylobacter geochelonis]CZE47987.1 Thiaminase II [Campylobacter geochelonis]CZE48859.1 Thiaminase II [Campylobacter geochelonis]
MKLADLIQANKAVWDSYIYHDFVKNLANSKLKKEAFDHYLVQDYLFLKHYSRVYALGVYKSQNLDDMKFFLSILQDLINIEIEHHINYCAKFGITQEAMDATDEELATIAYTRYVLDVANMYSIPEILTALAPCAIGYSVIANAIGDDSAKLVFKDKNEDYKEWIEMYKDDGYTFLVKRFEEFIDKKLDKINLDSKRGQKLVKIFKNATMCEAGFWEQSFSKFHDKGGFCLIRKIFG